MPIYNNKNKKSGKAADAEVSEHGKSEAEIMENVAFDNNEEMSEGSLKGVSKSGSEDFKGKLRGKYITLKDVKTKEIKYVKRSEEERKTLRKAFDSTERKKFLRKLSENEELLKNAGLSEIDILDMKEGLVPEGWQVHHKLPLDDSGDNSFDNLVLIKNEPYHKVITNYQNATTKGLKEGEIKIIEFPIPDGNVYPKNK